MPVESISVRNPLISCQYTCRRLEKKRYLVGKNKLKASSNREHSAIVENTEQPYMRFTSFQKGQSNYKVKQTTYLCIVSINTLNICNKCSRNSLFTFGKYSHIQNNLFSISFSLYWWFLIWIQGLPGDWTLLFKINMCLEVDYIDFLGCWFTWCWLLKFC